MSNIPQKPYFKIIAGPLLAMIAFVIGVALPYPAYATTYNVTKTADTNDGTCDADCSLREAVAAASGAAGNDTINVPAGTYTLSSGQMQGNNGIISIVGAGSGTTIIDGNNASRIFEALWTSAGFNFQDIQLRNGNIANVGGCVKLTNQNTTITRAIFDNCTGTRGGAIFSDQVITVTVTDSTFSNNTANNTTSTGGGAIEAKGVTVTGSTFSGNQATNTGARGGAIYSPTSVSVTSSTFSNNQITTGGHGGAIFAGGTTTITTSSFNTNSTASGEGGAAYINNGGTAASITDSYFYNNSASGDGGAVRILETETTTIDGSTFESNSGGRGGALASFNGPTTITNSTFSGNSGTTEGGGIRSGASTVTLNYTTFYNNSAGNSNAGGAVLGNAITTLGTIFSGNTSNAAANACGWSTVTSSGYNVDHSSECGFTTTTGDVTGDPLLAALADNGGPTKTHAISSGPAVDGGPASCTAATGDVDQRNETRPQGSNCDIGAYEYVAASPPTNTFTSATYNSGTNTLVFTGTGFDTIDSVSTDVKTYMDWAKFSWDVNGDDGTTANISVAEADVTSLIITNATTLTLVFTTTKANAIESTTDAGIAGGADTIDITAGFSKNSGGTPATTDAVSDGTFTIDSNVYNVTKIADTAGICTLSDCSLREAISAANADTSATPGAPHIINIPADASPYAITLTGIEANNATGDFDIKEDIKLVGAGAGSTTISGQTGGGDYVFQLATGYTIAIEAMTITNNGNDSNQGSGGCLYSESNLTVKNTTFDNCKATNGGAIYIADGYTLTLDNSTFTNNVATSDTGGGGAVRSNGLTIQNGSTFQNNSTSGKGGAIYNITNDTTVNGTTLFDNNDTAKGSNDRGGAIYTTGNLTLNNTSGATTFQNNDALCGGAINVDSSAKTIIAYGSIFTSNTTSNHGGALCVYGGDLNDVTFTNNSTTNYGGAIYSLTNDLTLNGTNDFTNNDTAKLSSDNGGAIYSTGSISINATSGSTDFENNDAYCGGAINLNASGKTLTIKSSTFTTNTAANIGGALCIYGGTLSDVSFTSNSSTNEGGAIYSITNPLTINGTSNTFDSNSSTSSVGGAISAPSSAVDVTNTMFNLNTAAGNGGAISANNGSSCCTVTATDSTFTSNQATAGNGGAINARSGITLTDTTLHGNTASASGGGAFTAGGGATLTRVTISSNTATAGDGGGLWATSGVNAYNSTISGNTANASGKLGGGIYQSGTGGTCSFINTTFYNNSANSNGSSLRGGEACTMKNVLMTSNGTAKNCRYNTHTVTTSKEYHSTQAASCGFGALDSGLNVDTLKDNGGKTKTHALLAGSTAIDAGDSTTCAAAPISGSDQRGTVHSGTCDIGSYEFIAPAGVTISGTVYTDEGTTTITDGATVRLIINGTSVDTDTTSSGAYSITATPSTGDAMIVYVDGHASDGTTVTVSDGNALAALDIYQDRLIVRHDNGGSLTNANMTTALGAYSDAEILYTTDGSDNLTVSGSNTELFVWSGDTYTPGATIDTSHIDINGTLNAATNAINVSGNWDATGGSVSTNGTVTLDGAADQTVATSGQAFNTLVLNNTGTNGSADDVIISGTLDVSGTLTITDGDLDISTNNPTVNTAGAVNIGASGSIDVSGRTANWTFDGTSVLTDSSAGQDFEDVVVNGTSLTLGSNAKVQTMTVTAGTLDLGSSGFVLELDGTGTPLSNSGAFTAGTSTVKYTGSGSATDVTTLAYSSLQLTPTSATNYSLTGHLTGGSALTGSLTIDTNATLTTTGSNYNIALAGDWDNNGSFTAGTGTVTLSGTGQAINGSTTFNNLTKSVATADTLTFEAGGTTTINGTVTLNGASGQLLTLASSTGSSAWNFNVASGATKSIDYVSVSWSDASGSHASQKPIAPTNSTDGGNNADWFGSPTITVSKLSIVISDPVNGGSNPKRIPGAVIEYSIAPSNSGDGSPDADSLFVTDPLETANIEFYATGGVTFSDGTTSSALSLGTVTYSDEPAPGPYTYDYTPVPDGDGYDSNITSFKVTTTGTFAFGGAPSPSFTLKYRVRIK